MTNEEKDESINLRDFFRTTLEQAHIGRTITPKDLEHVSHNFGWPVGVKEGKVKSIDYSLPERVKLEIEFVSASLDTIYITTEHLGHYKIR